MSSDSTRAEIVLRAHDLSFSYTKDSDGRAFHLRVPDPGASGWVARVSNLDAMMKQVNARHTPKLTPEPVWFTKTISDIFISDPNGMNLELFENVPAPKSVN